MSTASFDPTEHPHRRYNPLTGKHVLVSPHRTKRPWNGQKEEPVRVQLPSYDPACYLCPGNKRLGAGETNPKYDHTFIFPNDFPALLPDPLPAMPEPSSSSSSDLFQLEPVRGRCSVLCFHPDHAITLARMAPQDIEKVIEKWRDVYETELAFLRDTGASDGYVQIFENRGAMMGASAPHPHGQIWTLNYVPDEVDVELEQFRKYAVKHAGDAAPVANGHEARANGSASASASGHCSGGACGGVEEGATPTRAGSPCLLCTYGATEAGNPERIVVKNEHWVAVVPFWAVWPYEILLLPYRRHIPSLSQMEPEEMSSLAEALKNLLVRYDGLFQCPFPYSMGIHQSPLSDAEGVSHIHFHFYPPLLRSSTVRKFLVGFEMLGEVQRDLTPEQAAAKLRDVPDVHYLDAKQ